MISVKNLVLPGFEGVPLRDVFRFVVKGFGKGVLVTRASSIAFNLLMALLPASIFLFTLIPFIPVPNLQQELIRLFDSLTPSEAHFFLESIIVEVISNKRGGLLIFMFIATLIFSTNGIHAIIHAFVVSSHKFKTRSWFNQRKISVVLLMLVVFMIAFSGFLLIYGQMAINKLEELQYLEKYLVYYLLVILKWIIIIILLFLAISFLYWLAPARRSDFRFISPGSIVATFLFILTSIGFSAYVNNFGPYNQIYGSIGTLIVIMIWLYLNSIALLIGFELNVSIREASNQHLPLNNNINFNGDIDQTVS